MFCVVNTIFKRLIFLLVMVNLPNMAIAADEKGITQETINKYREQAIKLNQKIKISKEDLESLSQEEAAVLNVLNKIDITLATSKNQILVYELELSEVEKELHKAQMLSGELETKVDSANEYAKKRLVAIYKMNNLGNLSMVASADSFSEFLFRKRALERIFAHDQKILMTLIQNQNQLNEVLGKIKIRKERKLELEKELKHQIADMALDRKKRGVILSEIRKKKVFGTRPY
jgi:murein hydrolase activator